MNEDVVKLQFGSKVVCQQVQLKHIDCLYRTLKDYTTVDPFSNVRSKYRDPLDEKTAEHLVQDVAPKLKLDLVLPVLKEFIATRLTEDTLGSSLSIKEMMFYSKEAFREMQWFSSGFPENISLSNIVDVFYKLQGHSKKGQ
eukprot:TRINITY_DN477_c1_g1_i1.p1 TRINITY_DN477_c1_g1~~TRINITY_DN477_c1_g1_i1.p1  ORF type:complete len:164 (-),score=24.21 TRINITY_DN477_c1_g1_i1:479-901(-)